MLLEAIIGLGLFVFILWKYLSPSKEQQVVCEESEQNQKSPFIQCNKEETVQNLVNKFDSISKKHVFNSKIIKPQPLEKSFKNPEQNIINLLPFKSEDLITPSILLKQREKLRAQKVSKRESPPKEKLAEFLEKTILSDDKIQSIIQNLSLDKSEILIHEEPAKILYPTSKDIKHFVKGEEYSFSDNAVNEQAAIDNITNIIKRFNTNDTQAEESDPSKAEEKPLLKRYLQQPGIPSALNFGSVIGELKNKTKNGGLKPVFKKFDSVDNAQAGYINETINKLLLQSKQLMRISRGFEYILQ